MSSLWSFGVDEPAPARSFEEVHRPAMERGARCDVCPLGVAGQGPIMGVIRRNSRLTIIGEAPGPHEVVEGIPFVGPSGLMLNQALLDGGMSRGDCSLSNTVLCLPPGEGGNYKEFVDDLMATWRRKVRAAERKGETPPPQPVLPSQACAPRLSRDIAEANSKVILAVGKQALEAVAHELHLPYGTTKSKSGEPRVNSIVKQHGAPVYVPDGRVLMSSYHPAFAFRAKEYIPVVRENLQRAAWVAAHDGHIPWTAPTFHLNPSADDVVAFCRRLLETGAEVTVDIETPMGGVYRTPHIRCIGFGARLGPDGRDEEAMCIPFRHMDGSHWWQTYEEGARAALAVREVLDKNPLVFQNGQFDTGVLLRLGFMTNRTKTFWDTMIAHHDTPDNDLPHDLGFIGRRFFCVEMWKADCLASTVPVVLADGSRQDIATLVRQRFAGKVLGQDADGKLCEAAVLGWVEIKKKTDQPWTSIRTAWDNRRSRNGLIVTPDHQVFTQRGKQRADAVKVGDLVAFPEERLTPEVEGAILGTLLGDGSLRAPPDKTHSKDTALAMAVGGTHVIDDNKCCLSHDKMRALPWLIHCRAPEFSVTTLNPEGSWVVQWRTESMRQMAHWLKCIFPDGENKRFPAQALPVLGPAGWAWLFMDDGSRIKSWKDPRIDGSRGGTSARPARVSLALCDFKRDDLLAVAAWCQEFFAGAVWVNAAGDVQFGVASARKFAEYVAPYVFPSQRYKLPDDIELPEFAGFALTRTNQPAMAPVIQVGPASGVRSPSKLWCLTTSTGNFFTSFGLVKNCDHKTVDNVHDAELHRYNALDITVTMRLVEPLRKQIAYWGTEKQFETDTKLAPRLREMGDLGLVIDEKRRGDFSGVLNWSAQRELYQLREIIGRPKFNPRSVPQLQDLIFQEWGYLPVLDASGYEIKRPAAGTETWQSNMLVEEDLEEAAGNPDGEVGSTSSAALIELMKKREMKEAHILFLKTLLEYRAYDKLRGTYVDNMAVMPVDWRAFGADVGVVDKVQALIWDSKLEAYVERVLIEPRSALSLLKATFSLHVTPTGRLSSYPNVQNLPAIGKANMREMIVAAPEHVLVAADWRQIEARLYAVDANDQLLLRTIREGKDIHSMNAASLLAKAPAEIEYWYKRIEEGEGIEPSQRKSFKKYWRTIAKRFAFLEIYGGEEDKLFSVMAQQRDKETGELAFPKIQRDDVERWHDNWHRLHPETKIWHLLCHQQCDATGFAAVPFLDGRKRFFLAGASQKNAVPNLKIQGGCMSIAHASYLKLTDAVPYRSWSPWTGVNLQVHDQLVMQVPKSRAEEAKRLMMECMYYEVGGVPIPPDAPKAGHRLAKLE